jgi:putative hydrolase of the HAD superfamily
MVEGCARAVSLDIWLTLVRSHPDFKQHRNELLRTSLGLRTDATEFAAALRAADRRADRLSEESGHDHALVDRLGLVLDDLGVPRDVLTADLVDDLLDRQEVLALEMPPVAMEPGLPDVLAATAEHLLVGVTSNTGMIPGRTMRRLLRSCGMLAPLSVLTFSDEVGAAKPAPAIFSATLEGFVRSDRQDLRAIEARDVVHVGDNPVADVTGARAVGMHPVLVDATVTTSDVLTALGASARRMVL